MSKTRGMIVWRGLSPHDSQPIVAILTPPGRNAKTGPIWALWILHATVEPAEARRTGQDSAQCGSCPLRSNQGCYVTAATGLRAVWRSYSSGRYREVTPPDAARIIASGKNRKLRLGAYGDPAMVPWSVLAPLVGAAESTVGYTHQWQWEYASHLRGVCMASADSPKAAAVALSRGWGVFAAYATVPAEVELCASDAAGVQCKDCMRCDGTPGRLIGIEIHGYQASKHVGKRSLTVIGG
jgi:hypothetical protein